MTQFRQRFLEAARYREATQGAGGSSWRWRIPFMCELGQGHQISSSWLSTKSSNNSHSLCCRDIYTCFLRAFCLLWPSRLFGKLSEPFWNWNYPYFVLNVSGALRQKSLSHFFAVIKLCPAANTHVFCTCQAARMGSARSWTWRGQWNWTLWVCLSPQILWVLIISLSHITTNMLILGAHFQT